MKLLMWNCLMNYYNVLQKKKKLPADSDKGELLKQSVQDPGTIFQERQLRRLDPVKYNCAGEEKIENVEYVVIDQFQKKFGSAIMHIKKQTVCSIAAEGVHLCRFGKLSWLQVATRTHIFLFDIFLLGARAFKNGLQVILEDQNILKVIHDCRWLSDCLSHKYGIVLSNVFDTQVADVLHFSMETGGFLPHCISSLQDCLTRHLRMSYKHVSFMEQRHREVKENPEIWFVRPLPPALLNILALKVAYLLPLRSLLLDKIMSDLTTLVDAYLKAFREGCGDPLGSIEASCMKLPQELRQLANMQKVRRENAVQMYQQNEEGLLIRKHLEPLRRKRVQEEENKPHGSNLIPSSNMASCCVGSWDLAGQNSIVKEHEVYNSKSTGNAGGDSRTESEIETITSVSCKSVSDMHKISGGNQPLAPKQQTKVALKKLGDYSQKAKMDK